MSRVFVDTSAFYALIVAEDQNHQHAHEVFTRAAREGWQLVTTNTVLAPRQDVFLV